MDAFRKRKLPVDLVEEAGATSVATNQGEQGTISTDCSASGHSGQSQEARSEGHVLGRMLESPAMKPFVRNQIIAGPSGKSNSGSHGQGNMAAKSSNGISSFGDPSAIAANGNETQVSGVPGQSRQLPAGITHSVSGSIGPYGSESEPSQSHQSTAGITGSESGSIGPHGSSLAPSQSHQSPAGIISSLSGSMVPYGSSLTPSQSYQFPAGITSGVSGSSGPHGSNLGGGNAVNGIASSTTGLSSAEMQEMKQKAMLEALAAHSAAIPTDLLTMCNASWQTNEAPAIFAQFGAARPGVCMVAIAPSASGVAQRCMASMDTTNVIAIVAQQHDFKARLLPVPNVGSRMDGVAPQFAIPQDLFKMRLRLWYLEWEARFGISPGSMTVPDADTIAHYAACWGAIGATFTRVETCVLQLQYFIRVMHCPFHSTTKQIEAQVWSETVAKTRMYVTSLKPLIEAFWENAPGRRKFYRVVTIVSCKGRQHSTMASLPPMDLAGVKDSALLDEAFERAIAKVFGRNTS